MPIVAGRTKKLSPLGKKSETCWKDRVLALLTMKYVIIISCVEVIDAVFHPQPH